MTRRPVPPAALAGASKVPLFEPAPDVVEWARRCFVGSKAVLCNPDHSHLGATVIGALWTSAPAKRSGRVIVGTCEMPSPKGGAWVKARQMAQLHGWFGARLPDFVLTFSAPYALACSDLEWCALVEHEMYHAAQARDRFGAPRFNRKTGRPVFAIRGHDVEEFVGVVRRYGAAGAGVEALVKAAGRPPEIGAARVAAICGTCNARIAA